MAEGCYEAELEEMGVGGVGGEADEGSGQAGTRAMGEAGARTHMEEVVCLGSGAKARGGNAGERDEDEGGTGWGGGGEGVDGVGRAGESNEAVGTSGILVAVSSTVSMCG